MTETTQPDPLAEELYLVLSDPESTLSEGSRRMVQCVIRQLEIRDAWRAKEERGDAAIDRLAALASAPPQAEHPVEELRRAVAAIGVVGQVDGHDVVRRLSVLDIIDRRRVPQ